MIPNAGIALGLHGGCGTLERSLLAEADWAESRSHIADALRAELQAAGWTVETTKAGTTLRR